ncbi:uncharacterized protein LOC120988914 isoform X2 [Bufo bufo]|uniref:uncharacterized protein LOC120988914 isoform X2 n=1 Tax=Bufo bufo TaxID=8384 RepID=UPI001ABEB403|nr:uncharacterized protein LOC120988914 isoform X2 [Bufo bufo]
MQFKDKVSFMEFSCCLPYLQIAIVISFIRPKQCYVKCNKKQKSFLMNLKAFDVLLGRHEVSEYEHTVILTKERMKIKGLRSNLLTLLKQYNDSLENMLDPHMCKMLKTKFRLPNSEDIYGQKLECCQLINVYIDFLKVIHKIVLKLPSRRLRHFFTNYMLI